AIRAHAAAVTPAASTVRPKACRGAGPPGAGLRANVLGHVAGARQNPPRPRMSIRRESAVEQRLVQFLARHPGADPAAVGPPDAEIVPGSGLTRRVAVCLFESMLQSRLQDLEARRLKDRGAGYYTIGSAGHETNAVFGYLL